jgi:hypothetical protein
MAHGNMPSFPATISIFDDLAIQHLAHQKVTFDTMIRKSAGSLSAVESQGSSVRASDGVLESSQYAAFHTHGVKEDSPTSSTLSGGYDEAPSQFDRALCKARNTFLGSISLEDFIETLHCEEVMTTKGYVIEAFALLSAEEKVMMKLPVLHPMFATDLRYPLVQRRVKVGNTNLYAFLHGIPFDGDDTSVLNVAEAFSKCAANDRLGPSAKMMGFLEHLVRASDD